MVEAGKIHHGWDVDDLGRYGYIYCAILSVVGLKPMTVTNEFKINFLRPAVGGDVLARAEVLKAGRRIVYGEIRLFMADDPKKLIGHATSSYIQPDG